MECKRSYFAAIATFSLFFFLYFNLRSLHTQSSTAFDDFFQRAGDDNGRGARHGYASGNVDGYGADWVDPFDRNGPANATLGFGAIFAVSTKDSKRRKGLTQAAKLTDLQITIPDQPKWSDRDIESMKDREYSIVTKGSAMAWLGHLNAIQAFLDSNLTTALIIEDDVDWDIHIRHHQVPLVAAQMRALLAANPATPRDDYTAIREFNRQQSYWGDLTQWEVLYLGHCGDNFDLKYWGDLPHNIFKDESVPDFSQLHPDTQQWLSEAGIGQKQRMIHRSKNPLCSFAYALNRRSAERMLRELSHEEYGHGTWSFDVRLLEACRDMDWKCWTSNPELFHHQDEHDSSITEVNGQPLFEMKPQWGDGSTPNIGCGARSARFSTQDPRQVRMIKQMTRHLDVCSVDDLGEKVRYLDHEDQKDPL